MARRQPSAKAQAAMQTIADLFSKHGLNATVPDVRRQIRARFDQDDFSTYMAALAVLDGEGAIG